MLTLSRKVGEKIILETESGQQISIMLVDCGINRAKIGIEADRSVKIWREELGEGTAGFRGVSPSPKR